MTRKQSSIRLRTSLHETNETGGAERPVTARLNRAFHAHPRNASQSYASRSTVSSTRSSLAATPMVATDAASAALVATVATAAGGAGPSARGEGGSAVFMSTVRE